MLKSDAKLMTRKRVVCPNLMQYANETRSKGHFNDVTIIAENQCIPAQKMVLACHSTFFEKMFKCEMKEKYENKVEIPNLDGKAVKSLIDYIYNGNIDIDDENVLQLLAAADYLQLLDAKQFCFEYLEENLGIENWSEISKAVIMYRASVIKDKVYLFITEHFDEIITTDQFTALFQDDLKDLISNLDRSKVKETSIFEGIMKWIKHDLEARRDALLDLFRLIKIDQLPHEIIEKVMEEDLIKNNVECHRMMLSRLLEIIKKMNTAYDVKLISVGGHRTLSNVAEVYNLHGHAFNNHPEFPIKILGHCVLQGNGFIYCIGGAEDTVQYAQTYNCVWLANAEDQLRKWRKATPMHEKRFMMGATQYGDKLFVAGGNNGFYKLASAEMYDMPLNKWKKISSLNHPRCVNTLVSCQRCLHVLGGIGVNNVYLSSVEILNSSGGYWVESQPMLQPRAWFAAVTCDNAIYAIGGQCGPDVETRTNTVEKFNPDQKQWVYVSRMNVERCGHAACAINGKIYVVGGLDKNNQSVHTIECYTPLLNAWNIVGETHYDLYYHSIIAL